MAKNKDRTRGPPRVETEHGREKIYRGRVKRICPICDNVITYLPIHLRKTHGLNKDDEQYQYALKRAHKFQGQSQEITCRGRSIVRKNQQAIWERQATAMDLVVPHKAKPSRAILILAQQLEVGSESSSDDDNYIPENKEPDVIPPTPHKDSSTTANPSMRPPILEKEGSDGDEDEDWEEEEDEERLDADSEFEDDNILLAFYRRSKQPKAVQDKFLLTFCNHLMGLDGGHVKERHAIHHAQNVRMIMTALDPLSDDLECLFEEGGLAISKKWATPILQNKEKKLGTVKTYLTSVAKFFTFLCHAYELDRKKKLPSLVNRVKGWVSGHFSAI